MQFANVVKEFRKKQKDLDAWAKKEKATRIEAMLKELKESKKERKKQVTESGTTEQRKMIERQENKKQISTEVYLGQMKENHILNSKTFGNIYKIQELGQWKEIKH